MNTRYGAGNRTRTGTLFTARDFKSLVSTYSTTPADVGCMNQRGTYNSTFWVFRQGDFMGVFVIYVSKTRNTS